MPVAHTTLAELADCFNYEYQSRSSEESAEVLASLARRMAGCIEDERARAYFLSVAGISGLEVILHPEDVQLESARRDPRGISDGCGTN